jgi:hypothetical protein
MTFIAIPFPIDEFMGAAIWFMAIIVLLFFLRMGTKEGWYFYIGKDDRGIFKVPKEAIEYIRDVASEDKINDYIKRGIFAIGWFYITYLILLMTVIGASVIVDKNMSYKIPCLILVIMMQIIVLSKPALMVIEFVEEWCLKLLAVVYISNVERNEPLCISYSKTRKALHTTVTEILYGTKKGV